MVTAAVQYDALGRRVEKDVDSDVERYVYSGHETVAVYDGSNNRIRDFIYGSRIDEILAMDQADPSGCRRGRQLYDQWRGAVSEKKYADAALERARKELSEASAAVAAAVANQLSAYEALMAALAANWVGPEGDGQRCSLVSRWWRLLEPQLYDQGMASIDALSAANAARQSAVNSPTAAQARANSLAAAVTDARGELGNFFRERFSERVDGVEIRFGYDSDASENGFLAARGDSLEYMDTHSDIPDFSAGEVRPSTSGIGPRAIPM